MDSCAALLLLLLLVTSSAACYADPSGHEFRGDAVAVESEEVCVVGLSEVKACYCALLSLRGIDTGEGFLRHWSWLRIESTNLLGQDDAVGPLGTRMVIGFKNYGGDGSSELFNDTAVGPKMRAANLGKIEQLLKEIVGGEPIGWSSVGSLSPDGHARVVQSPFKTMVVLQGGADLGAEMESLVPKPFKDAVPDVSFKGDRSGASTLGLWHWLPASPFNILKKQDVWPSFFSSLGSKLESRSQSFLPKWLASRASLWDKELSSSQWQVLQRSLTLISPQDKRRSLSLSFCESARSSSPPKCTASTAKAGESDVVYNIPSASRLQVKLDSTDLSDCKPAGDDNEERWVLQDIQRTLVGSGAHRVLHSTLTLSGPQTLGDGCHLRLVERLPTGVFADQFELQGIQRRGGIKEAWIHGDKNLEQPALLSGQSILVVDVALQRINGTGTAASESVLQAGVAIPLHARYPPLSVDSYTVVHIPLPHVFVTCQQQQQPGNGGGGSKWNQVVAGNAGVSTEFGGVLDWMVPAGHPADYGAVARFTAISALTGVLVILGASVSGERHV